MTSSSWPGWLALALNVAGAGFVAQSIVASHSAGRPLWVLVVGLIAVAAWIARSVCALVGARRTGLVLALLSAATGAIVTPATGGVAVVPVAISLLVIVGDISRPLGLGLATAGGSVALIVAGALPFDTPVAAVLAELGGVLLAVFAGLSRRQFRRTEQQSALLREREAAIREEAARIALARDLHDVLAHSLGGLVVQLDAVDALLEAGDVEGVRRRVVDARGLAADGLADARRAVAALRDPASAAAAPVTATVLAAALDDLVRAHRALGGAVEFHADGGARALSAPQAALLQRTLQEALSNARKHAPGQPVTAHLDWKDDRVTLHLSNPLPPSGVADASGGLARTGGGHGLDGMRERVAALALGGTVTAGEADGRFAVRVEVRLA